MTGGSGAGRSYVRQPSRFRDRVSADGTTPYPAEPGRYHLYASWACPWSHRTIIGRALKGLEDAIGLSTVDPVRDGRGWAFTGGEHVDHLNGWSFLSEAYLASDPAYDGRFSSPVLWDRVARRIVSNESSDILRMLDRGFGDLADRSTVLCPPELEREIDALNDRIYEALNNGVYRAGFTTDQATYEQEALGVFAMLAELEERLSSSRFLFGDLPVETDWRLFTTLVRFDSVYAIHFKCSLRRLVDHPSLWAYTRDLYQWPGIAGTVRFDDIRRHYYLTHPGINGNLLVPLLPDADFTAPHGRDRLTAHR